MTAYIIESLRGHYLRPSMREVSDAEDVSTKLLEAMAYIGRSDAVIYRVDGGDVYAFDHQAACDGGVDEPTLAASPVVDDA